MGFCCFVRLPDFGPGRHFISCTLLAICASAVLISIHMFEPVEDLTPSPDADFASRMGRVLLIAIIGISGLAAMVHLLVFVAADRENQARIIVEEEREMKQESRSWLENFLDPQLLNSPKHIQQREKYFETLVTVSRTYRLGLLLPSLSLMVILLIRLFMGAPVFLGDPVSFDFGWKLGVADGEDAEKSISFTPDANTYGHLVQGVLSSLLATPVLMRGLIRLARSRLRSLMLLAPYAFTIYPTYSLIKRFIKAHHSFAGSSFANNGFEWACGFILGLAIGQLITAVCSGAYMIRSRGAQRATWLDEEKQEGNRSKGNDLYDDDDLKAPGCIRLLQKLLGILLVFTVYSAAILYGMTWYACEEGQECVNTVSIAGEEEPEDFSSKILIIMVVVPSVIIVGGPCFFG